MATPTSWSWRDIPGTLGPTTDQGACGSCTVFAVIGTMEAHMRIWYGIDTKLSEQEAMQCCGGCGGGTNSYIYDYAKNGATYGKDFKYVGKVLEECNTRRLRVPGSKVLSYYRIQRGADAVKNAMWHLTNVGPLATGLCVPGSFGSYRGGVYDDENLSDCGWHAVMIVGFGNEKGKDFWLARNSYGSSFGDNGYFKILRGKNLCKLEDDFTFPNMGW